MSELFDRLCAARGIDSIFISPKYEALTDPFELLDMERAVTRITESVKKQEQILIYGDYDVDGITASIVMKEALKLTGVSERNIEIMLPDRFIDGYGMSPRLLDFVKKKNINLVITVDCGSSNGTIIDQLNELGVDVVVTDHHEVPEVLPRAIAVINPHRKDSPANQLSNLAGVGVAFKVAEALVRKGLIREGQEKWLLDLVTLGTICDSMKLTGENRVLGFYGLKVLAKTRRPGLKEIMRRAGVKKLNSEAIGFQIGPRLNAAGRLESAEISFNLLDSSSLTEAASLAEKLEQLNKKRKNEQLSAMREIKERGISDESVIVEVGKWHEGILGIVAGHLVEDYHRPAFALADVGDGLLKGSGRSFGDFNLATALNHTKDLIDGGGGHAGAAGVRVKKDNLPAFRQALNDYYQSLNLKNQEDYFREHPDLDVYDFKDFSLELLDELQLLEPFGPGNSEPVFRLKDVEVKSVIRMGTERNHLWLDLRDKNGRFLKCIAFYAPDSWLNFDPEIERIEPLVSFIENSFNGVRSLEARLIDLGKQG